MSTIEKILLVPNTVPQGWVRAYEEDELHKLRKDRYVMLMDMGFSEEDARTMSAYAGCLPCEPN